MWLIGTDSVTAGTTSGENDYMAVNSCGAIHVQITDGSSELNWQDQNKPKPKRFLEQLRQELGDWHGDILERAA